MAATTERADREAAQTGGAHLAVFRRCGLRADALDALSGDASTAALDRLSAARAGLEGVRVTLIGALGEEVPTAAGAARAAILDLRRAVLGSRMLRADAAHARLPADVLDRHRSGIDAWRDAVADAASREAEAASALTEAMDEANLSLLHLTKGPVVGRATALTTPSLARQLMYASAADLRAGTKLSRPATLLVTRTALKASPLSWLTTIGTGDQPPADGEPAPGAASVQLQRSLGREILVLLATRPEYERALDYTVAGPPLKDGGRLWAILPRYTGELGFFWRQDGFTDVTAYAPVWGVLSAGRRYARGELVAALSSIDPDPSALARRLAQVGIVRPVMPWSRSSDGELESLAALLAAESSDGPAVAPAVSYVRECRQALSAVGAAGGLERVDALERLERGAQRLFRTSDGFLSSAYTVASLVREDVAHSADVRATVPPLVAAELEPLRHLACSALYCDPLYQTLVDHFVATCGEGREAPLLDVLLSFMHRADLASTFRAVMQAPVRHQTERDSDDDAPVPDAVFVGFYLQEAADNLVALNDVTVNGIGALARSFGVGTDGAAGAELVRQLRAAHPSEVLLCELPIAADSSNLQSRSAGLLPPLLWPGELESADDGGALYAADLRMVHRAAEQRLELRDSRGRTVAPVYTGIVPLNLVFGPLRLLLTICHPWRLSSRVPVRIPELRPPEPLREPVVRPRRTMGRVVLDRKQWRFPAAAVPSPSVAASPVAAVLELDRWRREQELPREVFVRFETESTSLARTDRKPLWVDFASPHVVTAVLGPDLRRAVNVTFEEALPSRAASRQRGHVGEYLVVTELEPS